MKNTTLLSRILFAVILASVLVCPVVLGAQNSITNITGNATTLHFALTTTQVTTNPGIGDNVTYCTTINVTAGAAKWNLTSFYFNLPDNSTTKVATDFVLRNSSNAQKNATEFIKGNYNSVYFSGLGTLAYLNETGNATIFNITYKLESPIASTKLTTSKSGKTYTETWNITSSATNLTIENASLNVTPSYWYTRIGNPTIVTFNSTSKDYTASYSDILVYTDLNLSDNLIEYGSGWGTLSISYNEPDVDSSSGESPTPTPMVTPPSENAKRFLLFFILGIVGLALIIGVVVLLKKTK